MNESPEREHSPLDLPPGWTDRSAGIKIVRKVASTAQSVVYMAHQELLARTVALKIRTQNTSPDFRRFQLEAKILQALDHPNIGRVYGAGELNGYHYLTMEWLVGEDLSEILRKRALSLFELRKLVRDVCSALSYAHAAGVIHRDVKPSNIFVETNSETGEITARLIDFGIARVIDNAQEMTRTDALLGSPGYMSPEQCSQSEIAPTSDVYSLGCVLYECLAGRPVFTAASPMDCMYKHQHEEPLPIENYGGASQVILKCLRKKPEERFANVEEFLNAWERVDLAAKPTRLSKSKRTGLTTAALAVFAVAGAGTAFAFLTKNSDSALSNNGQLSSSLLLQSSVRVEDIEKIGNLEERIKVCEAIERKGTRDPLRTIVVCRIHIDANENAFRATSLSLEPARHILSLYSQADNHPDVTFAMLKASQVFRDTGHFPEAERLCRLSISMREKYGKKNVTHDVASYRTDLARLFYAMGRFDEASSEVKVALKGFSKQCLTTFSEAEARRVLAEVTFKSGRYGECQELCILDEKVCTPEYIKDWPAGVSDKRRRLMMALKEGADKRLRMLKNSPF